MANTPRPDAARPTTIGPVPEANEPGHHPEVDQDKPQRPPTLPPPATSSERLRFAFEFEPRVAPFSFAVGVTPWTTAVDIANHELRIRFGPWSLATPIDNVVDAVRTGPYALLKVAGPPHLSLADRGVTFATSTRGGVCLRFDEPVSGALPFGLLKHSAATVTVAGADVLVEALAGRGAR